MLPVIPTVEMLHAIGFARLFRDWILACLIECYETEICSSTTCVGKK
jgi:hypothetical protein